MISVHVIAETEGARGWVYALRVEHADGSSTSHELRLAWVDHNHWAGDRPLPPSRVAAAVSTYAAERIDAGLPARFDASTVRRWLPEVDRDLAALL